MQGAEEDKGANGVTRSSGKSSQLTRNAPETTASPRLHDTRSTDGDFPVNALIFRNPRSVDRATPSGSTDGDFPVKRLDFPVNPVPRELSRESPKVRRLSPKVRKCKSAKVRRLSPKVQKSESPKVRRLSPKVRKSKSAKARRLSPKVQKSESAKARRLSPKVRKSESPKSPEITNTQVAAILNENPSAWLEVRSLANSLSSTGTADESLYKQVQKRAGGMSGAGIIERRGTSYRVAAEVGDESKVERVQLARKFVGRERVGTEILGRPFTMNVAKISVTEAVA